MKQEDKRLFRKKPVIIEAVLYDGSKESIASVLRLGKDCSGAIGLFPDCLTIKTLEGTHKAGVGDWIIKGIQGELYPCKPDIFEQTYEPADKSPALSEQRREKALFDLLQDERYEDACVCDRTTLKPCEQWNLSASYCMRKSPSACPKVKQTIALFNEEEIRNNERERIKWEETEKRIKIRATCNCWIDVIAMHEDGIDIESIARRVRAENDYMSTRVDVHEVSRMIFHYNKKRQALKGEKEVSNE